MLNEYRNGRKSPQKSEMIKAVDTQEIPPQKPKGGGKKKNHWGKNETTN